MPKDPVMLLSYVNTKLRDQYSSLAELASAEGVAAEDIIASLAKINYVYDEELNQFK